MKKSSLLVLTVFLLGIITVINAQDPPPTPVAPAAPVLRDDNIRLRSVELERAKREAAKENAKNDSVTVNTELDAKFPEIKEDFEGMQVSQSEIVKAYTTNETIDYQTIKLSADKINKHAMRLNSNLFTTKAKKEKDEQKGGKMKAETVRDLIVALDNAVGAVAASKMFQNLRIVEPEVAEKTNADLAAVIRISAKLSKAAEKMK